MTGYFDHIEEGDLDETITPLVPVAPAAKKQYPCRKCNGTGQYQGFRTRQAASECFSCRGRGFHLQAPEKRLAANAKRKATAARNLAEGIAAFKAEHSELYEALQGMASWNNVASSMISDLHEFGKLHENRIAAAERMVTKVHQKQEERQAQREAEQEAKSANVGDVSRIRELFDTALENGKNRRALLAARLDRDEHGVPVLDENGKHIVLNNIKMTPARSPRTEIWVNVDGEFCGGINENGNFRARREAPVWLAEELGRLAADPESEARLYGRATGNCCMCARELTDPKSVEAGIGPICAAKWGV